MADIQSNDKKETSTSAVSSGVSKTLSTAGTVAKTELSDLVDFIMISFGELTKAISDLAASLGKNSKGEKS